MKTHYDYTGIGNDISFEYIQEITKQLPNEFITAEFKAYFGYWYKLKNPGSLLHLLKKNGIVKPVGKVPKSNQIKYQLSQNFRTK